MNKEDITTLELIPRIENLEKTQEKLLNNQVEIKESLRRLETHNTFVVSLYLHLRESLINFRKIMKSVKNEEKLKLLNN